MDDVFAEKGRLLIQKEHEATAKGFRIGEVLHSAYFDLEFPELQIGPRCEWSRSHNHHRAFSLSLV